MYRFFVVAIALLTFGKIAAFIVVMLLVGK